jgi:hypothetical protein
MNAQPEAASKFKVRTRIQSQAAGAGLTIGAVARRAAGNVETVRYYERRGLPVRPPRCRGGVRARTAGERVRGKTFHVF